MRLLIVSLLLSLLSPGVQADNTPALIAKPQAIKKALSAHAPMTITASNKTRFDQVQAQVTLLAKTLKQPLPAPHTLLTPAYYFVSFSMPHRLLLQSIQEASRYGISVVIRGLVKNSFHETALALFDLAKNKDQGGVLLDPLLFRQYHVQVVPTLVVVQGKKTDRLQGNVSITNALNVIVSEGETATTAKALLQQGGHHA